MLQTYRASGRCGSTFYLATLGLLVFAAVAGFVYQKVVDVVPFIYVNFLVTLGFGFGITTALAKAQALGRCRSSRAALVAGVLVAAAALASSHFAAFRFLQDDVVEMVVADVQADLQEEGVPDADRPAILEQVRADVRGEYGFSEYLENRFEYGWTIGSGDGFELSGIFVVLVWLIEAGILGVAGVKGALALKGDAYCETCDQWADAVAGRIVTGNPKRADVTAVRKTDVPAELFPPGESRHASAHSHLVHEWKQCAGCQQGFLDVVLLRYVPQEKGPVKTETETIRSNLLVDDELREAFEAAAEAAAAAEQAALTPREPDDAEPR